MKWSEMIPKITVQIEPALAHLLEKKVPAGSRSFFRRRSNAKSAEASARRVHA
jgi:hypothetical protein